MGSPHQMERSERQFKPHILGLQLSVGENLRRSRRIWNSFGIICLEGWSWVTETSRSGWTGDATYYWRPSCAIPVRQTAADWNDVIRVGLKLDRSNWSLNEWTRVFFFFFTARQPVGCGESWDAISVDLIWRID